MNPNTLTGIVSDMLRRLENLERLNSTIGFRVVTGTTQQAEAHRGYIANNASLVTITLPVSSPVGLRIQVVGLGAGGWKIAQNASQKIHKSSSSTTTGTGGYIQSGNRYDAVELVCVVADLEWVVVGFSGTLTVA